MAKLFKFRLETVLTQRKREEDKRLGEWTLARNLLAEMVKARISHEERLERAIVEGTAIANAPLKTAGDFATFERFVSGLKTKIVWKKQEITRAEKLVEKKRLEYVAASQKRKALEKLREKRLEEYVEKIKKHELKQLDDIYVMRSAALKFNDESEENFIEEENGVSA